MEQYVQRDYGVALSKSEKQLKRDGSGKFDAAVDANSGLSVVRLFDNSTVQLCSSHAGVQPIQEVQRRVRRNARSILLPSPAIVVEYNDHIGGVDLIDMHSALYRIDHRGRK